MELERRALRDHVEAAVALACSKGRWEEPSLDFKRQLDPSMSSIAKLFKLLLAFANTLRNHEAYVIYGVSEENDAARAHVGVNDFPSRERIEQLLREHTNRENVVVDSDFILHGKRTPYISVPLQYRGPCRLTKPLSGAGKKIASDLIYMRSGSHIVLAGKFEEKKMEDWTTWF